MDIIKREIVEPIMDRFYIAFLSAKQYANIPSLKDIKLYEDVDFDFIRSPYRGLYDKVRFNNIHREYDEDSQCYTVMEDVAISPTFVIRDIEELED